MIAAVDTTVLGRTGLQVSVAGLGCGGHSRLGQRRGAPPGDSVALVERALDRGVNLIDTAAAYRTEEIVGRALKGRRDGVVISTKGHTRGRDGPSRSADLVRRFERSLTNLGTDYIDVYHLHGVGADEYAHCRDEFLPALERLREQGKLRFLGITERFATDPRHAMLERALRDDCWDVIMVGFNLLNPSARERVLAPAARKGVGTLIMFAVRRALSQPEELRRTVRALLEEGSIPPGAIDPDDPLGFAIGEGAAPSVVDAAYRFCRHEPGADVVLSGTGNVEHLEQNLTSLARGPLPPPILERLEAAFGSVDSVSGN